MPMSLNALPVVQDWIHELFVSHRVCHGVLRRPVSESTVTKLARSVI